MKFKDSLNNRQTQVFGVYQTVLCLVFIVIACGCGIAQPSSKANPIPLTSPEISGFSDPSRGVDAYYTFIAGPGELYITLELENAKPRNPLNQVGGPNLIDLVGFNLTGDDGRFLYLVLDAKKFEIKEARSTIAFPKNKQSVLLHLLIDPNKIGSGQYRLRIAGAAEFNQASNAAVTQPKTQAGNRRDKNSPEILTSSEISGTADRKTDPASVGDFYYTFIAGPGQLTMDFSVQAKYPSGTMGIAVGVSLTGDNGQRINWKVQSPDLKSISEIPGVLLHSTTSNNKKSGKVYADIPYKQRLVVTVFIDDSTGQGSYRIVFNGAIDPNLNK